MEAEIATKEQLLEQIEQEWQMLADLIEPLDAEVMAEPVLANGWSVKDTLAHIMSWEQLLIGWLGDSLAGATPERPFTSDDWVDRVNERVHSDHLHVPLDEVRDAFTTSHEEVVERVATLTADDLFDPERFPWLQGTPLWRMVAQNTCWHYREHRELIADSLPSA